MPHQLATGWQGYIPRRILPLPRLSLIPGTHEPLLATPAYGSFPKSGCVAFPNGKGGEETGSARSVSSENFVLDISSLTLKVVCILVPCLSRRKKKRKRKKEKKRKGHFDLNENKNLTCLVCSTHVHIPLSVQAPPAVAPVLAVCGVASPPHFSLGPAFRPTLALDDWSWRCSPGLKTGEELAHVGCRGERGQPPPCMSSRKRQAVCMSALKKKNDWSPTGSCLR